MYNTMFHYHCVHGMYILNVIFLLHFFKRFMALHMCSMSANNVYVRVLLELRPGLCINSVLPVFPHTTAKFSSNYVMITSTSGVAL